MKKVIIYPLVLLFIFTSCRKKDLPVPEKNEPDFFVNCNIDGTYREFKAGDDDYYMNASWYRADTGDIFVYKGHLAKKAGQGYQVTILFNDDRKTGVSDAMNADSALRTGHRLYDDQNPSRLIQGIAFTPLKAKGNGSFSWRITDGVSAWNYAGDGLYGITPEFTVGTTYSVTLDYDDNTGVCSNIHSSAFKAGNKVWTNITAIRSTTASEPTYAFSYVPPSIVGANWKCLWKFDNNTTSVAPNTTKIFQAGTTSTVTLTLTNQTTGDSCISYYQLHAAAVPPPCDANYTAVFLPAQDRRLYSSVTVLLTDENGTVYSSKNLVQPGTSNFEILEVADYTKNERDERTKSLDVKFNCIVKNGAKEINLTDCRARIAVAYK